jgi:hypothetical protein
MKSAKYVLVFGVALVILAVLAPAARGQQPACCSITAIDARTATVKAKVNATGKTFEFSVNDTKLVPSLKVGQPVYANFTTQQVSLDGKTIAGTIVRPVNAPTLPGVIGRPTGTTTASQSPPANKKAIVIVVEEDQAQTYSAKRADFFKATKAVLDLGLDDLGLNVPSELKTIAKEVKEVRDDLLKAIRNGFKAMLSDAVKAEQATIGGGSAHTCLTDALSVLSQSLVSGPQPGQVFLDRYGEPAYAACFRDMAAPYYERVVVLTDRTATYDNFKSTLEALNQQGFTIDVLLDVHGCGDRSATDPALNNAPCSDDALIFAKNTPNNWVTKQLLGQINNGKAMNLNTVYMVSCWGSQFNQTWSGLGAKASNGSKELNYYVLLSPLVFMHYWTKGNLPLPQAASRGYDFEHILFHGKAWEIKFEWKDPITGQKHTVEKISVGVEWGGLLNKALASQYGNDKKKPIHTEASSARVAAGNPNIRR